MSIKRIPEDEIVKGKSRPDSFYDYLTSRFLAKPLSPILIALGMTNPNAVTVVSFCILFAGAALFVLGKTGTPEGRVAAALLIQLSFTLDCADGQIARVLKKTSLFGAWFDKYLDRIGEMLLYASIGYAVWVEKGSVMYLALGFFIGFSFTMYTLLFTLRDGIFYEEIKKNGLLIQRKKSSEEQTKEDEKSANAEYTASKKKRGEKKHRPLVGRRLLNGRGVGGILPYLFFYLNIGIGERYFYPVLFTLLNKNGIMLFIVSVLVFLRTSNVFLIQRKKLKTGEARGAGQV